MRIFVGNNTRQMRYLAALLFFVLPITASAQTKLELTPQGFMPLEVKTPNRPLDKLIEIAKAWAPYFNKKGYDISGVTENSLIVQGRFENAFYYYNLGVKYNHDIRYSLKITFIETGNYNLDFSVTEIYAKNVLLKTTPADFFNTEGKLKDDFRDAKPSLETTANKVVKSFIGFLAQ